MNDAQRNEWAPLCNGINKQVAKNKLETAFEAVKAHLLAFIGLRRIEPQNLPNYKVQEVFVDYNCMTIVTDTGHFVHVSAEPGYHDSVDFSTGECPDIEDSHDMGILSQEQYDKYEKAQQDYLGQRRELRARHQMESLVREAGAASVQEYLDELKQ